MTTTYEGKNAQVHTIIETAINALMAIGASHETALSLLATQAIFKMTDLDQLRQMRAEINSSIICNDHTISDDTCVIIRECNCIQEPDPNSLN